MQAEAIENDEKKVPGNDNATGKGESITGEPEWLPWVLFGLYGIALILVACFHEPWYDEAEAWQMARGASLHDLIFYIPHYEGHPALWYLILAIPAKLGVPYEIGLKTIACAAAFLYGWLFLFRSPFPKVIRYCLPFHYFFFYQYGVISRPYGLMVLCLLLMAMAFRDKDQRPWRFILPMMALCALSGYGIVLAGGICIAWVWDICVEKNWKLFSGSFWKDKRVIGLLALLLIAVLIILEIMPRTDTYATSKSASNPLVIRLLYTFFLMLPDSTVLTVLEGAAFLSKAHIAIPILLVGILIGAILLTVMISASNGRNLKFLVIPYFLFAIFAALVYFCAHHMGMMLAFAVFWFWISLEEEDAFSIGRKTLGRLKLSSQDQKTLKGVGKLGMAILLIMPLYWTVSASVLDIATPYYYGRDMAEFLRRIGLYQLKVMGEYDIMQMPEEGEFDPYEYVNTGLIARPVAALPYFEHNFCMNLNMGQDSGGYALHRLPSATENKAAMEKWQKMGLPDVIIGPMDLEYVFGEEAEKVKYVPVYEYKPFANIWKAFTSKYNIVYREYIYLRSDLLEQYGLSEVETSKLQ